MPKFNDLTGKTFGLWTVVGRSENHITESGLSFTAWLCRCKCGTERVVLTNGLTSGKSTSCGCEHRETMKDVARNNFKTHGETKTRLYQVWAGMKKRCYNQNCISYKNYGGSGIKVCDEWVDNFVCFKEWAMDHGYNDNLTIDRIDASGDYCPDNCRWSDYFEQANNKRNTRRFSIGDESHTLAEWARIKGVPYKRVHKRIKNGASIEEALQ